MKKSFTIPVETGSLFYILYVFHNAGILKCSKMYADLWSF